jgi:hypothetical protein
MKEIELVELVEDVELLVEQAELLVEQVELLVV